MADDKYKENLEGRHFGEWKVLEDRGFWCLCRCHCGTVDTVRRERLLRKLSENCGHCSSPTVCESGAKYVSENDIPVIRIRKKRRRRVNTQSILGQRFGMLKVIEEMRDDSGVSWCRCECECGNIKMVRRGNLTTGNTKTCGKHKRNK